MNFFKPISVLALLALTVSGCASSAKKFDYPAGTVSSEEMTRMETEMNSAMRNNVDVLSPTHFSKAQDKFQDAKKASSKGKPNNEILEDLGYARIQLEAATAVASKAEAAFPEVTKARLDAIAAGAPTLRREDFKDADSSLKDVTKDFEKGDYKVSVERRGKLHKRYLDVELAAIKASYLDETRGLIKAAKKMKAEKYSKSTLASAEAKLNAAERTIETDRHNTGAIVRSTDDAKAEAKRLIEITRIATGTRDQSPEEIALAIMAKKNEALRNEARAMSAQEQLAAAEGTIQSKNTEIQSKNTEMSTAAQAAAAQRAALQGDMSKLEGDKAKLESESRFNEAFKTAQQRFSSEESVVYRQGDDLVIRLKQMQFPSGRAELPNDSLDLLGKIKDVVETMKAENIRVEGHTDAIGAKDANLKLSEKRAEAVAKYFVTTSGLDSNNVEAKGFGDSRPLVSNKTKDGRAQNRRVDVVISPTKGMSSEHNANDGHDHSAHSGSMNNTQ